MKFTKTTPCHNCPFRRDGIKLGHPLRAVEIVRTQGCFPCHKTTSGDGDDYTPSPDEHMCAGFLIHHEKQGTPNQVMQIAERLGAYDPGKLNRTIDDQIIDDPMEMVEP